VSNPEEKPKRRFLKAKRRLMRNKRKEPDTGFDNEDTPPTKKRKIEEELVGFGDTPSKHNRTIKRAKRRFTVSIFNVITSEYIYIFFFYEDLFLISNLCITALQQKEDRSRWCL